ncbi:MAG: hypothetical protein GFH27_549301n155 [Chloroflexi bacterium AL-W]|nr:hypothetical protein [Chloroflexi bacterium AL-N1]NOK68348.1 hypothetical protein [Chloroflexi bacterium AL-N10]NOK73994.1 hypothetical protein [Chloroflexi bacterium AL-N5]NOK82962.1 hypothetical protein [Chloroflexi bacterium AL-W]NOK90484.1 hypothetical protein [Chloroflexi bacterium AL-N15]
MSKSPSFLRMEEAAALVRDEEDLITKRLLLAARYYLGRVVHEQAPPVTDFDVYFLYQFLQVFCSQHELLQQILDGEEVGL